MDPLLLALIRRLRSGETVTQLSTNTSAVIVGVSLDHHITIITSRGQETIPPDVFLKCFKLQDHQPIWIPGRAFVHVERGDVDYFVAFEDLQGQTCIRSYMGWLRPLQECRPLDYIRHVNA